MVVWTVYAGEYGLCPPIRQVDQENEVFLVHSKFVSFVLIMQTSDGTSSLWG